MTSAAQDSAPTRHMEFLRQEAIEIKAMPVWQVRALRFGLLRSCLNCENFNKVKEECMLPVPNQRPPAVVIALGCEAWIMEIPF